MITGRLHCQEGLMNRLMGTVLLIGLFPLAAVAQGYNSAKQDAFFYVAPGVRTGLHTDTVMATQVGGGVEGFVTPNLGAELDMGGLKPSDSIWLGTLSANMVARFRVKGDANGVEPFITGGYTLFFRSGTANGYNFGGGVNYWFSRHVGLRLEGRDSVWVNAGAPDLNFVGFRVGLSFR
jgi:hypothetical protein